jgi:hypothetical protein
MPKASKRFIANLNEAVWRNATIFHIGAKGAQIGAEFTTIEGPLQRSSGWPSYAQ